MDGPAPPPPQDPPAYVYAATDMRPRQAREIELCAKASEFDWKYTGAAFASTVTSVLVNAWYLKQQQEPGVRMIAPAWTGLSWGLLLGGGYLSLPKCDPLWTGGPPPEGNIRADWPIAASIAMLATASAPLLDFTFMGAMKPEWTDTERVMRVFIGAGAGLAGSLIPYLLPPTTWAAKKEIDKLRVAPVSGGGFVSYSMSF